MKRLFAAIKVHPSEALLNRYYMLQRNLKDEKIRWVSPENIHITMKFFGETPDHHIPAINAALQQAATTASPFNFSIRNTGIFGSTYNPKVIWFGIEPHKGFINLSENILGELDKIGIERDRQNFVPHLTIARMNQVNDKKFFQQLIDENKEGLMQEEEVNTFHLFDSELSPKGPIYTILGSYSLFF